MQEATVVLSTDRLAHPGGRIGPGWVALAAERIVASGGPPAPTGPATIDLGDLVVAPGFVDVHVHGGDGHQVNGTDPEAVHAAVLGVARAHAAHGTTALVAATVSDTIDTLEASLAGVARAVVSPPGGGAQVLGSHLEGPWLSPSRRGAHDPSLLAPPDGDTVRRLLAAAGGTLRLVTLAPELPGGLEAVRSLTAAGVTVSVGHTDTDAEGAGRAFAAGASHLTHCFNAMRPLLHREPGPVGAALADGTVTIEVIADGVHVDPVVVGLLARLAGPRLVAVTDAAAACGLPEGRYHLGALPVDVAGGAVRLASDSGTLAGSVLTMDGAVAGLVAAGVPLGAALHAASTAPAAVVGAGHKGTLAAGADADLVLLGPDLRARATVVRGRVTHDADGLLEGVLEGAPPAP